MSNIIYTGTPHNSESFYDKLDKQRKERDKSDKEFFQRVSGSWSDDILPEGERPKYELNNTEGVVMKIYKQLEKDLEESGATSFTIADIRAARNKVFTGNKEGEVK